MFRRLLLTAVAATGITTGLTATADAHPPVPTHGPHCVRYQVLVRHHHHFDVYGIYDSRYEAERVARRLEYRGHDAIVRRV